MADICLPSRTTRRKSKQEDEQFIRQLRSRGIVIQERRQVIGETKSTGAMKPVGEA